MTRTACKWGERDEVSFITVLKLWKGTELE